MLLISLLTSLQTALGNPTVDAQPAVTPAAEVVEEATILDTSPRSFRAGVPLGDVESYTLSFIDEVSDVVVGQATLVDADNEATRLYIEMDEGYTEARLALGTCTDADRAMEAFTFEPPTEEKEPLEVDLSLEEVLHPRLDYMLEVDTVSTSYCQEL
ncbi:MAG TPA: hypothetical protein VF209_04205 [Patescibacteria group bacterium]